MRAGLGAAAAAAFLEGSGPPLCGAGGGQTGPTREEGLLLAVSVRNDKEEEGREKLGEWPPKGGDAEAGAALGEKAGSGRPRNGRV